MLDCIACTRRCIQALAARSSVPTYRVRISQGWMPSGTTSPVGKRWTHAVATSAWERRPATTVPPRTKLGHDPAERTRGRREVGRRRAVQLELVYLKDPFKLAEHVRVSLRDGGFDKALDMVREASKDLACTVSWNHLMNYQMHQGKVSAALKTYNEMKKRGQTPDGYTYTLLLRGLAENAHYPHALAKALALYHSLFAPHAPLKPSLIHTNAVLNVCARAGDMDSLWGIAARLPDHGPGAPDDWTFATILNAIRANATAAAGPQEPEEQARRRKAKAVLDGRRVWEDIEGKWRDGRIQVTEELACAMGRLLLVGDRPGDWDDVLSLAEQAFDVKRVVPRLVNVGGKGGLLPSPSETETADAEDAPRPFMPLASPRVSRGRTSTFQHAAAKNNALSLVMEACTKLHLKQAGSDYWALLTGRDGFAIPPDGNNYVTYLRLLRQFRCSREATELFLDRILPTGDKPLIRKSLRLAMSACKRDKNNAHSFGHAGQLFSAMRTALPTADARTMLIYIQRAALTEDEQLILGALQELQTAFEPLLLARPDSGRARPDATDIDAAVEVANRMIGAYDQLARREHEPVHAAARRRLRLFVTRWNAGVEGGMSGAELWRRRREGRGRRQERVVDGAEE
ncbi:MAG: hypothetical protein M1832_000565 [Thelocarpon impressellum]|nr:MAG: hypothetical protein M1832_000565 [Thelocarpon impressellum]